MLLLRHLAIKAQIPLWCRCPQPVTPSSAYCTRVSTVQSSPRAWLKSLAARTDLDLPDGCRWIVSTSNLASGRLGSRLSGRRLANTCPRLGFDPSSAHIEFGRCLFRLSHAGFGLDHSRLGVGQCCRFLGGVQLAGVSGELIHPRRLLCVAHTVPLGSTWPHYVRPHTRAYVGLHALSRDNNVLWRPVSYTDCAPHRILLGGSV